VDADTQASRYQRDFGTFQPKVLLTEWAGVHLEFPTGTVTSHYETALRYQAAAPELQAFMTARYSWTPQIVAVINWDAHGKALRRHLYKRSHLVKHIHGLLPTNAQLHRSDPRRSKCPSCQCIESWQHILRCQSESHVAWYKDTTKTMEKTCKDLGTTPRLTALLLEALREWCVHSPDESMYQLRSPDTSPVLRRLIFQQNAIGWDQLFIGRFSSEWGTLRDEYYARQSRSTENKRQTGQRWQIAIISTLWQQWFLLWEMRNKELHGADSRSQAQAERRVVERTLIDIYDIRNQMEPSVQQLLHRDIAEHFSKTMAYNKNWLAVYGPLVKMSIKRAKDKAIQGVKSLRHYFGPK
jgi:hypothetical protein